MMMIVIMIWSYKDDDDHHSHCDPIVHGWWSHCKWTMMLMMVTSYTYQLYMTHQICHRRMNRRTSRLSESDYLLVANIWLVLPVQASILQHIETLDNSIRSQFLQSLHNSNQLTWKSSTGGGLGTWPAHLLLIRMSRNSWLSFCHQQVIIYIAFYGGGGGEGGVSCPVLVGCPTRLTLL